MWDLRTLEWGQRGLRGGCVGAAWELRGGCIQLSGGCVGAAPER